MREVLSSSANPKFRNSKFLKFLNKIDNGAYTVQGNEIIKDAEKLLEFREEENARLENE